MFFADARPRVFYFQPDNITGVFMDGCQADLNVLIGRCEFDGVGQQVVQDLVPFILIKIGFPAVERRQQDQTQALLAGQRLEPADEFFGVGDKVPAGHFGFHAAAFDLG